MHNVQRNATHNQRSRQLSLNMYTIPLATIHWVFLSLHDIPVGSTHQRTNALNYTQNRSHLRQLTASQIHLRNDTTLSRYISPIQSLVSYRKSVCFLKCLHFEINSFLLLRILFPLNIAIPSFSFRQRLQLSDKRLKRKDLLKILRFIWGTEFLLFTFKNYFESSASFLYAALLKDLLWLLYLF